MIHIRDFLWRLKIGVLSRWVALKTKAACFAERLRHFSIRPNVRECLPAAKDFLRQTPATLLLWTSQAKNGRLRLFLLFVLLSVLFGLAAKPLYFIANDGFVSFRYVAQAVDGHGFVWNPPPFEPVNGYSGFIWLICLRALWFFGIQPPLSADLLSFAFSMGCVAFGFLFLRRMPMFSNLQAKSLFLFLLYCLILLTNKTFLMFFWSGTETALFNFLVLWWTFAVTDKAKHPVGQAVIAVLLALTRWDGAPFLPFALIIALFSFKESKMRTLLALAVLATPRFYVEYAEKKYGSAIPLSFTAFHKDFMPFGLDYIGSFVVEYALWFWLFFAAVWAGFKVLRHKTADLFFPVLLCCFFVIYVGTYTVLMGADVLEYRPLSFLIPLIAIGAFRILTGNITKNMRTIAVIVGVYLLLASAIPLAQSRLTRDLTSRRQTAFLYKPLQPEHRHFYTFFADYWNQAQKRLIYQGAALRHKEHQAFFNGLKNSLPTREEGKLLKPEYRRLMAWDFAGQIAWTFPYVYILDTSGQNDLFGSKADFKYASRRLLGHERNVPAGYADCFGGNTLLITPFDNTPDVQYVPAPFPLTDGVITGCEKLWHYQGKLAEFKRNPVLRNPKQKP